jgi:Schitoviridae RNA polymerase
MTTRVVNIKNKQDFDVYIGNKIRLHPQKYPQTKWGNPYAKYLKRLGRDKVVTMYKEYVMSKPESLKLISSELKGKTLGCWCKPLPCHGDILAEIADR